MSDLESQFSDQGLDFILHTVLVFIARMAFVIWKYLLQNDIDINYLK